MNNIVRYFPGIWLPKIVIVPLEREANRTYYSWDNRCRLLLLKCEVLEISTVVEILKVSRDIEIFIDKRVSDVFPSARK